MNTFTRTFTWPLRRQFLHATTASLSLLFAAGAGAQDLATSFRSIDVAPGVQMLVGEGGFSANMGLLIGADQVALVDDGLEPLAPLLVEHLTATLGRPVNFIINTHMHGDHAGGNSHFADQGTVVFAHENVRKRLLADAKSAGGVNGLPTVTFGDGVNFHLDGLEAQVLHTPGAHTDGDAAIFLPELNVLFTGDLLFHGMFPFIDLESGGSVSGYLAAQERLLELANETTKIVPGHGELTGKAGLLEDHAMLKSAMSKVRARVEAGKSADEIVAENPLAEFHDKYNWAFITTERMTRTLVQDLQATAR